MRHRLASAAPAAVGLLAAAVLAGTLAPGAADARRLVEKGTPVPAASVRIFAEDAACRGGRALGEIGFTQAQMTVAEIFRALRLEAAAMGGNAVRSIRIRAAGDGRFTVSALAIRCEDMKETDREAATPPTTETPAAPATAGPGPGPKAAAFLGADVTRIVGTATGATAYKVARRPGTGEQTVLGYPVTEQGPELAPEEIARLRALILDDASYEFDKSKRCPFLPSVGVTFRAGAEEASVLLSFNCALWGFGAGDGARPGIEDFDPVADELKAMAAKLLKIDTP